jgi:hypothetical protein
MGTLLVDMSSLFAQLGRANDADSIRRFIDAAPQLSGEMQLHEALFWSASEAAFLREALLDDAEWAEVVDALNSELHAAHPASG